MKVSAALDYSLRALTEIARAAELGTVVTAQQISERQAIPQAYLARILATLVRAEVLSSARGHHGGYRLTVDPGALTVAAVCRHIDGWSVGVDGGIPGLLELPETAAATVGLWATVEATLRTVVESITIDDLVRGGSVSARDGSALQASTV